MTQRLMLSKTTLLAALAVAPVAMSQGVLKADNGDNGVSIGQGEGNLPGTLWPGDLPLTEETILGNLEIYADREEIALLAVWNGPGPHDIQLILSGQYPNWLADLEAAGREWFEAGGSIPELKIKPSAGRRAKGRTHDAGLADPFNRPGDEPDNRAHTVSRLWPSASVNGTFLARVPYSFDDDMVAAWALRGADPDDIDPEQLNSIAGVASTLATMLIIEQLLPVQFVGFNPQTDPATGFLQISNQGDENFDPTTGIGPNQVSRIGRANTGNLSEEEPTTITHETWGNFPSIVRSIGFALGMDWEQRRADRDSFIIVQPQNIPPFGFPQLNPEVNGNNGPGTPAVVGPGGLAATGPLLFDDNTLLTDLFNGSGCSFDFDSIMLMRPFEISGLPSYIIRDEYRYVDMNGDMVLDLTPFGDDDRMVAPPSIFFSACDIAAITEVYAAGFRWFYGFNPNCPHDVNNDGIQGGDDLLEFIDLWEAGASSADLVPPLGVINLLDLQAFSLGDEDNGIEIFTPGYCHDQGLPGPGFLPDDRLNPPG